MADAQLARWPAMQSELEAPVTSAKKKAKKQRAAVLDELLGGPKDGGSRATTVRRAAPTAHPARRRTAALHSSLAVWAALGFRQCGGTTSVRVRIETLCLLLEHGVCVREPLSVRVLCALVCREYSQPVSLPPGVQLWLIS